jgi:hypothetical protein
MNRKTIVFRLFGIILLLGFAVFPVQSKEKTATGKGTGTGNEAAPSPVLGSSIYGEWKEYWGIPGLTDVTYHDRYRITPTADGGVDVEIISRDQPVYDENFDGRKLTFTQRSDSYILHYSFVLSQDGWLVGTVETPEKTEIVKWEKTAELDE